MFKRSVGIGIGLSIVLIAMVAVNGVAAAKGRSILEGKIIFESLPPGVAVRLVSAPKTAVSGDIISLRFEATNFRSVPSYISLEVNKEAAPIEFEARLLTAKEVPVRHEWWPLLSAEFRAEFGSYRMLRIEPKATTDILVRVYIEAASNPLYWQWKDEGPCELWTPGLGPG